jgi:hypothetical protein
MWETVREFWCGLAPQLQAAVVGALATVVSATIGASIVFWQIGKQAQNAIRQNRDNEALKLKLKIYEEIIVMCHEACDAEVGLSSYIRQFQSDVWLIRQMIQSGSPYPIPRCRATVLLEKRNLLSDKTIQIIQFTERWQIIDPRLEIFRTAINVANHDITTSFQTYFNTAIGIMPHEFPSGHPQQGTVVPWSPPSDHIFVTIRLATRVVSFWL